MIEISTIGVWGFEGALAGMRLPYESGAKSDSRWWDCKEVDCENCTSSIGVNDCSSQRKFFIGEADMALCKKLIKGGSEHRKFLRMIHVQAEVKAPRYWWAEMDKYKWVEANSSSTMHLITKRELMMNDFSRDGAYNTTVFEGVINSLNTVINLYNALDSGETKEACFRAIKQLLPESYNQLRMIDTNYECLLSIYHQRSHHRLSEWREFCDWELTLPYFKEFVEALNG